MDAITTHALPESVGMPQFIRAKAAVTAFLYLYMILRQDGKPKYVSNLIYIILVLMRFVVGPASASPLVLRFLSEQV